MLYGSRLFRVSLWLATTSLSMAVAAPALAQPAPPDDAVAPAAGDPPALAGRLADVTGTVSTRAAGQTDWIAAGLNDPVTSGDSFWTEPHSGAVIEAGADHFVLNEQTELDVTQLDQTEFVGTAAQGEVYFGLRSLPDRQTVTVNTPRGSVQISAAGQYDIAAGDSDTPTTVTVISGGARVTGSGVDLSVGPGQAATLSGGDQVAGTVGPAQPDQFTLAQLHREAPALPADIPSQVRYMTGGSDLARYGAWQATAEYGQVWYPRNVAADWAPYRTGHWAYVGPWGWTWVDAEPWGFAPFHYGRWVSYGGRWGWVAAAPDAPPNALPVYAPALVAFLGVGAGVGWVPLGFREPFRPWYHVSDRYLQSVNRVSVVNVSNITVNTSHNVTVNNYVNARGATVVPAGALVRGQNLAGMARPMPAAELARAQPVVGRLPVTPSAQTPGLTRGEAARYNISLPARPGGRAAPGPQIVAGGVPSRPGPAGHGPRVLPPLRPVAAPAAPRQAAEAAPRREDVQPAPRGGQPTFVRRTTNPPLRGPGPAPAPHATKRPEPDARPAPAPRPRPEARPVPEARQAARPLPRPAPEARPAPRPAAPAARRAPPPPTEKRPQ